MSQKKFLNRIRSAFYAMAGRQVTDADREFLISLGGDGWTPRRAMAETTYYTCIKVLSESIGKLPLKLYRRTDVGIERAPTGTGAYRLLSLRPNHYMTATTFWTLMEMWTQHYGNGFAYIDGKFEPSGRFGGGYSITGFYPMHPQNVRILIDDAGLFGTTGCLYYEYTNPDTGAVLVLHDYEVMHFKTWYSKDGIIGQPVCEILNETIEGASAGADYQNSMYKNGLTAAMVMEYTGTLDESRAKEVQRRFADRMSGPDAAGRVIPLPEQLKLVPLNVPTLSQNQYFEIRKYTSLQIGAAFGIRASQLNNLENSKYAASEYDQLDYLVNTLSYRIKAYEEEINAKVLTPKEFSDGFFYKFNEKALLRTDSKTQSEILKNYVQGGIYTPNEARDFLDRPHIEGGDTLLVNGSYVPIKDAGAAYNRRA